MKTAKAMFEELGLYERETPFQDLIRYGEYMTGAITFDTTYRIIDTNSTIGIQMYRAITQQMKELGWIE